ncbi:hypothetical protein SAMD00024442_69_9 [Candidatus Symbiothrix dinenymphae]|nr:hypothetical protein SAMD00024442_69_9 [Candidatus Symbiothrix dinenymphae]
MNTKIMNEPQVLKNLALVGAKEAQTMSEGSLLTGRYFLTIEEVRQLKNTPCLYPTIKQAFLFACYSGLRFSGVQNLLWGNLQKDSNGGTFINYVQRKTQKQEYLPLSQIALNYLTCRNGAADGDFVFNLPSSVTVNKQLKHWGFAAKINKKITFHVARHTHATLLLSLSVPIETVSKILRHSNIKTTQIYLDTLHGVVNI